MDGTREPNLTALLEFEQTLNEDKVDPSKDVYKFFAGNPSVELIRGKIHLFRPVEATEKALLSQLPEQRSPIVLVLAVPSLMSIAEFVAFAGSFAQKMRNVRILRDNSPNRYMVLIKFHDQKDANAFYVEFNGKSFSSLAPEVCHTAFVKQIQFTHPKNSPVWPPAGHAELPTCTICLEKLDSSVSGLLTVLCNHSFHCDCISRWREENRCPICRYMQTPSGDRSTCNSCGIEEGLWICIVCGYVGCSRYKNKHSAQHYHDTKHTYAMEVDTQRVWDYTRDAYVHRLVTNITDGKVVEIPNSDWQSELENTLKRTDLGLAKEEAMQLESQYLLDAQLETQRRFFEERIRLLEKQNQSKVSFLEQEFAQILEEKLAYAKLLQETERQKRSLEKRTKGCNSFTIAS